MKQLLHKLVICSFFALSLSPILGQEVSNTQDTLHLKVKLLTNLESVHLPAYCGVVAWRMTFEFEVLEVVEGTYDEHSIAISILCPRESVENKWLVTGKSYEFRLTESEVNPTDGFGLDSDWMENYSMVYEVVN